MSTPEIKPHHDYSPSTLQSLEACPCYQGKQSDTPHPRTVIGTLSHEAIETGEDNARLADEDIEKVAECIDFYERRKQLMEEARQRVVEEIAKTVGLEVANQSVESIREFKEVYLPIDDLEFSDALPDGTQRAVKSTTAGYLDCAIIDHTGTYAEIFDWKLGLWPVEAAENNLQGIAYALGVFKRFPNLQRVRYFFVQPNLEYVTDAEITREDVESLYLRIQVVVARARAARIAGDFKAASPMVPACNFCSHIARCPAVTQFACNVGSKFFPVEIPSDITPTMVHSAEDTNLGLRLAAVLEVWAGSFKRIVADRVIRRDAEAPDGYAIQSRTPREIVDTAKYREVALKYLTEAEYAGTLKASFGKVEELISEKAPRGQKASEVQRFGTEVEECGAVVKGQGYAFLRAVPQKPSKKQETNEQEKSKL